MYFWKIEALKSEVIRGDFGDERVFPYVLAYTGLTAVAFEIFNYLPRYATNFWDYTESVFIVLIAIGGTVYVYHANGGGGGRNFASKFFGIGFVVGIRFLALAVLLLAGLTAYWLYAFGEAETVPTTPLEVAVFSAWYAALYVRIAKHIRDTAEAQNA